MQQSPRPLSARKMNKIIWIFVAIFSLCAGSFLIALKRVADNEKFAGFHVKSLTEEYKPAQEIAKVQPAETPAKIETPTHAQTPAKITDPTELDKLKNTVYDSINKAWQTSPSFSENLVYQISVNSEGTMTDIEPVNQPAKEFVKETPFSEILQNSQTENNGKASSPIAKFTVIFTPSGLLEVSK